MSDPFNRHVSGLESPASNAFAITPSDSADLASATRSIFVGGGGNLCVTMKSGAIVTFNGLMAGSILPVRVTRVASTGTTATNLVGLA
jgi:hypothetical protein